MQTANEVADLEIFDPARVTYLTQTTLAVDETAEIVGRCGHSSPRYGTRRPTTSATPPRTGRTP